MLSGAEGMVGSAFKGNEAGFVFLLEHKLVQGASRAFDLPVWQDIGRHPGESIPLGIDAGYCLGVQVVVFAATLGNANQPAPSIPVCQGWPDVLSPCARAKVREFIDNPTIPGLTLNTLRPVKTDNDEFGTGYQGNRQIRLPDQTTQQLLRHQGLEVVPPDALRLLTGRCGGEIPVIMPSALCRLP